MIQGQQPIGTSVSNGNAEWFDKKRHVCKVAALLP